jgi:hypothetical protein
MVRLMLARKLSDYLDAMEERESFDTEKLKSQAA